MTEETSSRTMWAVIAQALTLLSVITHFVWQAYKTYRREQWQEKLRQWEIEDREALAKKVTEEAVELARQARLNAEQLSGQSHGHTRRIEEAIQKNTEITIDAKEKAGAAYDAANNLNLKLVSVGIDRNALDRRDVERRERQHDRLEKEKLEDDK